jgi:predicted Fe-Mo cluster-binding NifX family protein
MKAAFPYWQSRLAPVFDTARQLRLIESEAATITDQAEEVLPDLAPSSKILRLVELNVETLVCGAISRPLREMASAHGITVIPFIAGELEEVIGSWIAGRLETGSFAMPGCCQGRGRRLRGRGAKNDRPCNADNDRETAPGGIRRKFRGK